MEQWEARVEPNPGLAVPRRSTFKVLLQILEMEDSMLRWV